MDSQQKLQETTRQYFDRTAEEYDHSRDGRFVRCMYGEILRRAAALPGKRILDLGCGNGNVLCLLRNERAAEYFGADLSEAMIREAGRRAGGGVDLRVADVADLPYADEMFDIIICNASFHHYTEPGRAVSEIRRVLKNGGTLILGDPTLPGKLPLKILNWGLRWGNKGDYRIYGKREIIRMFTEYGFEVGGWKYIHCHSFVVNAVKRMRRTG